MTKSSLARALAFGLLLAAACGPRPPEPEYVARIGDVVIAVDEFESRATRLMMTSHRGIDPDDPAARRALLKDIIAQKLLLVEGLARGLDRDSVIADEVGRVRQRSLIDTLYGRRTGRGSYQFPDDQVEAFYRQRGFDTAVRSEQIVCETRERAVQALEKLTSGADFPSLVPAYSTQAARQRSGDDGDVGWWILVDMPEGLQPHLRRMEVGDLSVEPVESRLGFHVFRLTGRRPVALDSVRARIVKAMRHEAIGDERSALVAELRQRVAMEHHDDALRALAAVPADQHEWRQPDRNLVTWKDGALTIQDYMAMFRLGRVRHPASQTLDGLGQLVDNLAGQRIMAAEAARLEYDELPDIVTAVDRELTHRVARALFRAEGLARARPVSDDDVRAYYEANLDRYTTDDGKVTPLERLATSIRRQLRDEAQNQAMDAFLDSLHQAYADDIEIRADVLATANLALPGEAED